jgi:hypothetical protein
MEQRIAHDLAHCHRHQTQLLRRPRHSPRNVSLSVKAAHRVRAFERITHPQSAFGIYVRFHILWKVKISSRSKRHLMTNPIDSPAKNPPIEVVYHCNSCGIESKEATCFLRPSNKALPLVRTCITCLESLGRRAGAPAIHELMRQARKTIAQQIARVFAHIVT